jgi:hypothetical protein
MKKWSDIVRIGTSKGFRIAVASGFLFVAVIAAYYYGSSIYTNSSHSSGVTAAWSVILMCTSAALAALVALGIPYIYSKDAGFIKFIKIVLVECILLACALAISGFFFFPRSDDCEQHPNSNNCYGSGSGTINN